MFNLTSEADLIQIIYDKLSFRVMIFTYLVKKKEKTSLSALGILSSVSVMLTD